MAGACWRVRPKQEAHRAGLRERPQVEGPHVVFLHNQTTTYTSDLVSEVIGDKEHSTLGWAALCSKFHREAATDAY